MRINFKFVPLLLILGCSINFHAMADQILGSGSTFVYPVMSSWSAAYFEISGVDIGYQPVGSAGGITEIKAGTTDFGASDAPLKPEDLARDGLAQFPIVIGGIVPVVNLEGITSGQLKFTGPLLADIYLGKIKRWNDPAIAAANADVVLPDRAITVVFRTDGSGTTFNWADYLSKVSAEWKSKIGAGTSVSWPVGAGAKGNGGVADAVTRVKGAIGYVEYSYVLKKSLTFGLVQNHAGNFISPSAVTFQAAAESADWSGTHEFYLVMTDAPGAQAYPITATSFVLMYKEPKDAEHSARLLEFFKWALEHGQGEADALGYVSLPPPLVRQVEAYWKKEIR